MQHLVFDHVDHKHLARAKTSALDHALWIEVDQASLRTGDNQAIGSNCKSTRPKSVAIECGAHNLSIAEGDRCGSIPWLTTTGVIVQERADAIDDCWRQQHAHGLSQRATVL